MLFVSSLYTIAEERTKNPEPLQTQAKGSVGAHSSMDKKLTPGENSKESRPSSENQTKLSGKIPLVRRTQLY